MLVLKRIFQNVDAIIQGIINLHGQVTITVQ